MRKHKQKHAESMCALVDDKTPILQAALQTNPPHLIPHARHHRLQLKIDHCKERIDVKNHKIHELEATIEDNAAALKAAQEQAARMQALVQKQEESIRQVHDKLRKVKAQHEEDLLTRERFWKRTHGEQLPMIERLKADKHELVGGGVVGMWVGWVGGACAHD